MAQDSGLATPDARPARDRVYDYVRERILSGQVAGGTFLEEEQVSQAVGLSRTPVREAFQRLHAERLIDLLPRRGALVRPVSVQEMVDVYEARLLLETHAARRVCRAGDGAPPEMVRLLDEMHRLPPQAHAPHVALDVGFHTALVTAARNEVLADMYGTLRARQQRVALTSITTEPARLSEILREHGDLVAALEAGNEAAAAETLSWHLRPVREVISRLPGYVVPP